MKTKNIQDVVVEKVEEFDKRYAVHSEEMPKGATYSEQQLFFQLVERDKRIANWLTTTLTQLVKEVEAGEREQWLKHPLAQRITKEIERLTPIARRGGYDGMTAKIRIDALQALTPPTSDEALQDNK